MIVRIRTGLEVSKKGDFVKCAYVAAYEGNSESDATALFLCQAFQDLEDKKITSVLITRALDGQEETRKEKP